MKIFTPLILLVLLFFSSTSCHNSNLSKTISPEKYLFTHEIRCDTIYPNKKYKIILGTFSEEKSYDEGVYNSVFSFYKLQNGTYKKIVEDSVQSHFGEILFEDFNNDGVKDILVENISDVRSNLTYYLYLVDLKNDKLQKIKNFEQIKNPEYLPKYNLVSNLVMSGRNWTRFYKIQNDSIKDFNIMIEQGEDENDTYDQDYAKSIKAILEKNENN